jgi:RecB family exonuclease
MLARWHEHDARQVEASELDFAFDLAGARVRGRIDAIFRMNNGGLHILDYKTGKNAPTKKELEENLQLAVYYLGIKRSELAPMGEPKLLELAFLGAAHWKDGFVRRNLPVSQVEDYERRAEEKVTALIERVRAEDFTPQACEECRRCALRTLCPIQIEGGEVPV